jgi:ribA/ribD-fused uncharacterized protein
MRETNSHIYFYGGIYSNFYPCKIIYNKTEYISSEQLYMAKKALFFNDLNSYEKILKTDKPIKAKALGKKVANFSQAEWDLVKLDIMIECCFEKFNQNDNLKKQLISTNKILVEASPYDHTWGVKLSENDDRILDENQWQGQNLLGIALMQVRDKLINNQ